MKLAETEEFLQQDVSTASFMAYVKLCKSMVSSVNNEGKLLRKAQPYCTTSLIYNCCKHLTHLSGRLVKPQLQASILFNDWISPNFAGNVCRPLFPVTSNDSSPGRLQMLWWINNRMLKYHAILLVSWWSKHNWATHSIIRRKFQID